MQRKKELMPRAVQELIFEYANDATQGAATELESGSRQRQKYKEFYYTNAEYHKNEAEYFNHAKNTAFKLGIWYPGLAAVECGAKTHKAVGYTTFAVLILPALALGAVAGAAVGLKDLSMFSARKIKESVEECSAKKERDFWFK